MRKVREWFSIALAHHTRAFIALMIVLLNILFIFAGGLLLFYASQGLYANIPDAIIGTVKMILDAGFMRDTPDYRLTALLVLIVVVGMIVFSGATMGYLVAFISKLISEAEGGRKRLRISNHIVILNWNMRASEIINDLLYAQHKERVVVLVGKNREAVQREIAARIDSTLQAHRQQAEGCAGEGGNARIRHKPIVIVREGDIFSAVELHDISLSRAKTIIVLGRDTKNTSCQDGDSATQQGNVLTVKTLIQVADALSHSREENRPKVIVEVDDEWTERLTVIVAERIARLQKEHAPEISIIPVFRTLGQILAQFSIMPALNHVYSELFSNRGASFYTHTEAATGREPALVDWLATRPAALPLQWTWDGACRSLVYLANDEAALQHTCAPLPVTHTVELNPAYAIPGTHVLIIGHNSNCKAILDSFDSFRSEWGLQEQEPVHLCILDDTAHIDLWEERPYITRYPTQSIYDKDAVMALLRQALERHTDKLSILILSDDTLPPEAYDSYVLTYLIYVRELVDSLPQTARAVDIIVEILDPRHSDVVKSYSVENIVISNRYVSRIVLQCGEKDRLYRFYQDVLTYDEPGRPLSSKEIYLKRAGDYFVSLPPCMTEAELVQATFTASPADNPNVLLGVIDIMGVIRLFSGDRRDATVQLCEQDRLIVFACH
ncbi:MAG: hypothetical protein VB104_01625 [Candidatus Limiplasma sp.]|nr:hypothetical protein [Candidatus Limiplasma sp.]